MFYFLSKFLPPLIYPIGLTCLLLILVLCIRRDSVWQKRLVIVAVLLLWLSSNRLVTMVLLRSLEWQHPPPSTSESAVPHADVIVVLGGATRAQAFPRPTSELNEAGDRLLCAARLYRQGAAPRILLTGGKGVWVGSGKRPEAESMADILTSIGIPREALWLETASRNTHENGVETEAMLESRGAKSVILITSAVHMPRSYRVFANTDLEVIPVATDFLVTQEDWEYYTRPDPMIQLYNLLPAADNLAHTTQVLKEYVGICVYWLRGWL